LQDQRDGWLYYFTSALGIPRDAIIECNLDAYCTNNKFTLRARRKRGHSTSPTPTNVKLQLYMEHARQQLEGVAALNKMAPSADLFTNRPRAPTYWESADARNIFGAKDLESASDAIDRHINKLLSCNATLHAWKNLVDGSDEQHNSMTDYQIFDVRFRCKT
jgi:hypothetical protein